MGVGGARTFPPHVQCHWQGMVIGSMGRMLLPGQQAGRASATAIPPRLTASKAVHHGFPRPTLHHRLNLKFAFPRNGSSRAGPAAFSLPGILQ